MSAPVPMPDGAQPNSAPSGEPVTAEGVSEQQANPVEPQGSWEVRIRAHEPQLEGEQAKRLDSKRVAMIAKTQRWLRTKENVERREAEANKALREYREEIPHGSWGPLEPVLREGYGEKSERNFSRKLSAPGKEHDVSEQLPKSGQRGADHTEPAANRPMTRTEQLRAEHTLKARKELTKSARAERSDVFIRRVCDQFEIRYRGGNEGSLAERRKAALMVIEKLGLTSTDLTV